MTDPYGRNPFRAQPPEPGPGGGEPAAPESAAPGPDAPGLDAPGLDTPGPDTPGPDAPGDNLPDAFEPDRMGSGADGGLDPEVERWTPSSFGDGAGAAGWTRSEFAWPLSIFAGFAGTWAGLATGVPGLATLIGLGCIAYLMVSLRNQGQPMRAFGCALGGVIGVGGAVIGSVFEGGAEPLYALLPGSKLVGRQLGVLLAGGSPSPTEWLLFFGALPLGALALSRPTQGVAPLLAATYLTGTVALPVSARAVELALSGTNRLTGLSLGWPPGALAEAIGLVALAVAWGGPRGVPAPRPLVAGGLACLALGAIAWALAQPWAKLVGPAVGLS